MAAARIPPPHQPPPRRIWSGGYSTIRQLTQQVICLPVGPRCDLCLLGQQKLCPSRVAVNAANRKEVAVSFTADGGPKIEIGYEEEVKVEDGNGVQVESERGVKVETDSEVNAAAENEVKVEVKEEVVEPVVKVKLEPAL